ALSTTLTNPMICGFDFSGQFSQELPARISNYTVNPFNNRKLAFADAIRIPTTSACMTGLTFLGVWALP
ncbi:MAG: hypothetical protein M3541_20590, partial [Acidobacteriota bacterium]|nr:hypothetical protein [Acidobacteriota bacterium]